MPSATAPNRRPAIGKSLHHFQGPCGACPVLLIRFRLRSTLLNLPIAMGGSSFRRCANASFLMMQMSITAVFKRGHATLAPLLRCYGVSAPRLAGGWVKKPFISLASDLERGAPPPPAYAYCIYTVAKKGGKMRASSQHLRTHSASQSAPAEQRRSRFRTRIPCRRPTKTISTEKNTPPGVSKAPRACTDLRFQGKASIIPPAQNVQSDRKQNATRPTSRRHSRPGQRRHWRSRFDSGQT